MKCHVLHMERNSLPHAALNWAPPGKRRRGRHQGTGEELWKKGRNWLGRRGMNSADSSKTVLAGGD